MTPAGAAPYLPSDSTVAADPRTVNARADAHTVDARIKQKAELLKQKFEDGRFDHATYLGLLAKLYGVGDARTVEEEAEKLLKRELENGRLDSHATYVALLAKLYEV